MRDACVFKKGTGSRKVVSTELQIGRFYRQYFSWCVLALFIMALIFAGEGVASDNSKVFATGEGFTIDQDYMTAIVDYYSAASFSTSHDEYLATALKIKVFSMEARMLGLEPVDLDFARYLRDEGGGLAEQSSFAQLLDDVALAEAFSAHRLSGYPIDDQIIESYYHSYPGRFQSEDGVLPLDGTVRDGIRVMILETIKKRVVDALYAELEEKYAVQVDR